MDTKNATQSKTLWFNAATLVVTTVATLATDATFQQLVGDYNQYVVAFLAVGNMALRFMTNTGISSK